MINTLNTDTTTDYFQSIKDISVLTKEEEIELFRKYKETGAEEIKQKIMLHNQKLVISVAKKYKNMTLSLDMMDLVMEGNFGLSVAVDKFDVELGTKFSTYATHWIKQTITRAIDNYDKTVRIPVHFGAVVRKYYNFVNDYEEEYKQKPSEEEIKSELNLTEKQLKEIHKVNSVSMVSLNEQLTDEEEDEFIDFIADESVDMTKDIISEEFRQLVDEIIDKLWLKNANYKRNKDIIYRRFGFQNEEVCTLSSVGADYNISKERIRQIECKFIRECQKPRYKRRFAEYK